MRSLSISVGKCYAKRTNKTRMTAPMTITNMTTVEVPIDASAAAGRRIHHDVLYSKAASFSS